MNWEDFSERLQLDEAQEERIKKLLHMLQDRYTDLCLRPSTGSGKSPIEYAAEINIESPQIEQGEFAGRFMEFLSNEKEPESGNVYTEIGVMMDIDAREEIKELLRDDQIVNFGAIELSSLLNVNTGYDPFGDKLFSLIKERSTEEYLRSIDWETFKGEIELDEPRLAKIKSIINGSKEEFANTCMRPSAGNGDSPLQYAANLKTGDVPIDEEDFQRAFTAFLSEKTDAATGLSYLEISRNIDISARREVSRLLNDKEASELGAMHIRSLLYMDTGHDPLESRLNEQINLSRINKLAQKRGTRYKGFFCPLPFEYITVCDNGDVYLCSACKMLSSVGNLEGRSLMEIWNSELSVKVRESIYEGSYKYCNDNECELLQDNKLRKNEEFTGTGYEKVISEKETLVKKNPRIIEVSYDKSCNLSCPSCRETHIISSGSELERLEKIHQKVFGSSLEGVSRLMISGCGDPLSSKLHKDFLKTLNKDQYPDIRIKLQTNGLLLTPSVWESISNSHYAIDWISISIDAATKETYKLNRGGNFDHLMKNLEFVSSLRKANKIDAFNINFVVQANNFREMKQFIELGKKLGCDYIVFMRIMNLGIDYGLYSEDKYRKAAIHLDSHPLHKDFLNEMNDPVFLDPKIGLFKLIEFLPEEYRKQKDVDSIINYYPERERGRIYR